MRKNPMKSYLLKSIITSFVCICFVVSGFLFFDSIPALIISIFFVLITKWLIGFYARQDILSIILRDLDPIRFKNIIYSKKWFFPPLIFRMYAAVFSGDYQTTVYIITKILKKKLSNNVKCVYLSLLARVYFELGDLKTLSSIYEEFVKCADGKTNEKYSIMRFYRAFLEEKYDECLLICKESDDKRKPKSLSYNLSIVNTLYNRGIVYYRKGDYESASACFNKIVCLAPKMHIASIAKKYLEKIDLKEQDFITSPAILPNQKNESFEDKAALKIKKLKNIVHVIYIVCFVFIIVFLILGHIYDEKKNQLQQEKDAYEKKLSIALEEKYHTYELLQYFNVKRDGSVIAAVAIVGKNDGLDVVRVVTYDEGDKFYIIKLCENIELNRAYCTEIPISSYYIGFQLLDEKCERESCYKNVDFLYNSAAYFFCIDYIERVPRQ